jgi:hypothetical protein
MIPLTEQATTANTDVTSVTNGPLSIDANGNLTVAPNTMQEPTRLPTSL